MTAQKTVSFNAVVAIAAIAGMATMGFIMKQPAATAAPAPVVAPIDYAAITAAVKAGFPAPAPAPAPVAPAPAVKVVHVPAPAPAPQVVYVPAPAPAPVPIKVVIPPSGPAVYYYAAPAGCACR